MCVDYSELNNASPKDSFLLPKINHIVDALIGDELLSFLDAYSRCNQISILAKDAEKTAFTTPIGTFYYHVMPFGLKNTGATYQRMMSILFNPLLRNTMEVYINDMLVKFTKKDDHVSHLKVTFWLMREHKLKLNLKKCAFEVSSGNFLSHVVSKKGIEVTLEQLQAILNALTPYSLNQIQSLVKKLTISIDLGPPIS